MDHGKSAALEPAGWDALALDEAGLEQAEDQDGSAECAPTIPDSEERQDVQRAVRPWKAWGPGAAADHPDEADRQSADLVEAADSRGVGVALREAAASRETAQVWEFPVKMEELYEPRLRSDSQIRMVTPAAVAPAQVLARRSEHRGHLAPASQAWLAAAAELRDLPAAVAAARGFLAEYSVYRAACRLAHRMARQAPSAEPELQAARAGAQAAWTHAAAPSEAAMDPMRAVAAGVTAAMA